MNSSRQQKISAYQNGRILIISSDKLYQITNLLSSNTLKRKIQIHFTTITFNLPENNHPLNLLIKMMTVKAKKNYKKIHKFKKTYAVHEEQVESHHFQYKQTKKTDLFKKRLKFDEKEKKTISPRKTKRIKKKVKEGEKGKRDFRKNYVTHLAIALCRAYLNITNRKLVEHCQKKVGVLDYEAGKKFVEQRMHGTGFIILFNLVNFQVGTPTQRNFKKAFLAFERVYFRKRYSISLLLKGGSQDKEGYMEDKSLLLYLPSLTPNGLNKAKNIRKPFNRKGDSFLSIRQ